MNHKKILVGNLIVIICFIGIYIVIGSKYLGTELNEPFKVWWKDSIHYVFHLAMGVMINFEYMIDLLKYRGKLSIDLRRLLIICLPAFVLSLAITPYCLPHSIRLKALLVFNIDGFLLFFRILLGYNIISCIKMIPAEAD